MRVINHVVCVLITMDIFQLLNHTVVVFSLFVSI